MRYQYRKKKTQHKTLTSKQVGLRYGFRSGLEEVIAESLTKNSVDYTYEETKLSYVKPQKTHTYTPDFYLPKQKIFIETKGMFSNARARISKKSKTTYGMWCEKYGFLYAHKDIPKDWLD
jgi:G:T-mismatch repair DNA endonuclease (very short patch repair protein)